MKKCYKCNKEKPIVDFNKDSTRLNGLSYICRDCDHIKGGIFRESKAVFKKCSSCKTKKKLTNKFFAKNRTSKDGYAYNCKECNKKYNEAVLNNHHKNRDHNINRMKIYGSIKVNRAKRLIRDYQRIDNKKGMIFDLSFDDIINIIESPCTYCGDINEPIGCDRIDNSKGHTIDNVVPCCITCNTSRMNKFTSSEMILLGKTIRRIKDERNIL